MKAPEDGRRIVLYGPGRSGKTTALRDLAAVLPGGGRLVDLQAADGREAAFEFLGARRAQDGRPLHLLTVPGRLAFAADGLLLLRGADAVLFVADSRAWRLDANLLLLDELGAHLQDHGQTPGRFPIALLYTWRQDPSALAVEVLEQRLNPAHWPAVVSESPGDGAAALALDRLLTAVESAR